MRLHVVIFLQAIFLLLGVSGPAGAQARWSVLAPDASRDAPPYDGITALVPGDTIAPNVGQLAASGLLLGAAGALAGWFVIGAASQSLEGALIGATIAESALLPLGVHLGNRSRGNYPEAWILSTALGAAGLLFVFSNYTDDALTLASVVVPLVQLAGSIAVERDVHR